VTGSRGGLPGVIHPSVPAVGNITKKKLNDVFCVEGILYSIQIKKKCSRDTLLNTKSKKCSRDTLLNTNSNFFF
jgi:hypothetical protein